MGSIRFKMMIYPEMVNEGKGGCCFRLGPSLPE